MRRSLILAFLLTFVLASPAAAKVIQTGPLAAGGTWSLSAERKQLQGTKGVCLTLAATFADGTSPGSGTGCGYGSLRAGGNILPVSANSASGDTKTSSLVGGIVVASARTVKLQFTDGKAMTLRAKRPPKGWGSMLQARVRTFAGDALPVSAASVKRAIGYDARGRRVARSHE